MAIERNIESIFIKRPTSNLGTLKKRGRPSLSTEDRAENKAARVAAQLAMYSSLPFNSLVKQPVILALAAISSATLWRKIKEGVFPAPVMQTGSATAWRKGDVEAYLNGFSAA